MHGLAQIKIKKLKAFQTSTTKLNSTKNIVQSLVSNSYVIFKFKQVLFTC